MKRKIQFTALAVFALCLVSCKEDKVTDKPSNGVKNASENYNVSILLDLSDRIDPVKHPDKTMEYYVRDIGYIKSVSEAFTEHVRGKRVRQANDKMQLFFDPEPSNTEINAISDKLKTKIDKDNISKELLDNVKTTYETNPLQIYELAIKEKDYPGSDIWRFFKNKVTDYCIDEDYRNILVILTDGYIFYKNSEIKEGNRTNFLLSKTIKQNGLNVSQWKEKMNNNDFGFIKANEDLSNLEVLVLGINPDSKNPYEEDVIKAYWGKWLQEMKVKRFEIRGAELPSNMEKVIKDFINKGK
ncbi:MULTISPECIES: hypothetical protein [unclassified Flavobacterium]|uniref:hypothetical protein n=1 Tax=unclassified Flavobacterium TaxID=196869 RepID=UPI00086A683E|nr:MULTISPECIES: hypothetical protein [unclassified Flavobacterium]MBN9286265.1 hypothetical protein [Flavobacterium sp.]ODS79719.1 MAG: hypothetical protein ABS44_21040 [Chryseobacterium sp. SCN 40-13]OJV73798.1 MAG: hypothetical protein BGO42_14770 [Flavobacterium sp. 40-81]